jgi:quercetin dioxygenase-like cupin family protein
VFVYVLEGSIEMQVIGRGPVVLKAGDVFYEAPRDVHGAGRNLSATEPAKLVVFFVKDQGKAPVLPVTKD